MIRHSEHEELSEFQRGVIDSGLKSYERELPKNNTLRQGADLEHVRSVFEGSLRMGPSLGGDFVPGKENEDLTFIADHLFAADGHSKVVWVKNGNSESFALIAKGNQVILFDSHWNEISLMFTKEQVVTAVQAKLGHDKVHNLFDYSLGRVVKP